MDKYYSLTKTLILSGIQCEKKLWFDKNDKIKVGPKAIFEAGNRFNDIVRKHYGEGLDLSDEFDHKIAINKTSEAIKSDTGTPPIVASLEIGTMVSPWPPKTMQVTSCTE